MPLKIGDLQMTRVPKLPKVAAVFEVSTPSYSARRAGIDHLSAALRLGGLRSFEVDHGVIMASERGEIEFFHASGAVWARNAAAGRAAASELRKWDGVVESKTGGRRVKLNAEASRRLLGQARDLLESAGLIARDADISASVELDQVARLDAKGKEVAFGAGQATVKFAYTLEGMKVAGAGAKSLVFAEPRSVAGAFHAWRQLGGARKVEVPSVEEALGVGLLSDPELELYARAGHSVRLSRVDFVYLALPAFMRQAHLFPALQIEGSVSKGERGGGFDFARYHHAVPPKAYAAADLYAPYLAANPDGIAAAGRQQKR